MITTVRIAAAVTLVVGACTTALLYAGAIVTASSGRDTSSIETLFWVAFFVALLGGFVTLVLRKA